MAAWVRATVLTFLIVIPIAARAQWREGSDVELHKRPAGSAVVSGQQPDLQVAAESIIHQTNDFRKSDGRDAVAVNAKLTQTAHDFAQYMARTDRYGHTADGNRPSDRVKQHGYAFCIVAENIAYQFNSAGFATDKLAGGFFEGWKHSPEHRRNMLDADVTETGVAIAHSAHTGYFYAVQLFGRPESQKIEFTLTNESAAEIHYTIGDHTFPLPPHLIRTHSSCRPADVTIHWPGAEGRTQVVHPQNGEEFVVSGGDDQLELKRVARPPAAKQQPAK